MVVLVLASCQKGNEPVPYGDGLSQSAENWDGSNAREGGTPSTQGGGEQGTDPGKGGVVGGGTGTGDPSDPSTIIGGDDNEDDDDVDENFDLNGEGGGSDTNPSSSGQGGV